MRTMRLPRLLLVMLVMALMASAQDDFGTDDAGADMDLESMMDQGGGGDGKGTGQGKGPKREKTIIEQTQLALQQFGIVIGKNIFIHFNLSDDLVNYLNKVRGPGIRDLRKFT